MEQIDLYISMEVAEELADTALKVTELIATKDLELQQMRAMLVERWDALSVDVRKEEIDKIAKHKTRILRLFIKDYMRRSNGTTGA